MITLETSRDIEASPDKVWAVLTDFAAFGQWNPLVIEASGTLGLGEHLKILVNSPDGSGNHLRFHPKIVDLVPGQSLAWLGHLVFPGFFDGRHYYHVALKPDGTTRFTHGEVFSGLLVSLLGVRRIEAMRPGYEAMNDALARRVNAVN